MMSNCGFWSASGEWLAVHGVEGAHPTDARASFGPWAASRRLPPGRLVELSSAFPTPVSALGWQALVPLPGPRKSRSTKNVELAAPVATPAPALDEAALRLFPPLARHELFTVRAWPTWVSTAQPERDEGPEGWFAALGADGKTSRFLVRLVPHRGRLAGEGWRNMLAWALKFHSGVRLAPLNGLPTPAALAAVPAWEYRVEAGKGAESAAWDVQILPGRRLLQEWAPGITDPWEATALLRWVRPGAPAPAALSPGPREPRWADLFARLPVADARLLVQNVLTTLPGGASEAAILFFDSVTLPVGPSGKALVRHVPQEGLPLALLSTLFGARAWTEIDRAKKRLPSEDERRERRSAALADLDLRLAEGRLEWSPSAMDLWQGFYRDPVHRALEDELDQWRHNERWNELMVGDPRVPEGLFRSLDVTDIALCLRDAPDTRWRRFVTVRREAEIREEMAFCQAWAARGELTVERQIDAWRSWDSMTRGLALDDKGREK